jgi:signal transduction histidine kinase/ligand-binding sensor domain-containing protein
VHSRLNARYIVLLATGVLLFTQDLTGLNPAKSLTQYTRTVWTQEHGLPQDTIRAIVQTADGNLWLGTDEGLARFDGYEFVVFNKDNGDLPGNSVTALAAAPDGSLWIGTSNGLTCYKSRRFHTYTSRDGLADNGIAALVVDHTGAVWIVAGIYLSRFESGKFTTFAPGAGIPLDTARSVAEDRHHVIWVAGYGGVARREGDRFVRVLGAPFDSDLPLSLMCDRQDNLWIAGSNGLYMYSPSGSLRRYDTRDGLPDPFVRSVWQDRDGNIWAGTNNGLSRLEKGRFVASAIDGRHDPDWVRSIFEDREGNLWVGMNSGLNRFRDDIFTVYSKSDGLPSDEPTTVFQDSRGRIWVGFHDLGIGLFDAAGFKEFTTQNGLPSNEIFSIREARGGDLLVSTREGLSRMHNGRFTTYPAHDPFGRRIVFDAMEDSRGRLWIGAPGGLSEIRGQSARNVIPGGRIFNSSVVVLCEGRGGIIWAGSYGKGLWRLEGGQTHLFTVADGLSSDQIRSLVQDRDGTLWIGTFGGGLNALRGGRFHRYTTRNGLLSDNIAHIEDDGRGSLWLATTRGICRIAKRELAKFDEHKIRVLSPTNYGVEDGLRSAQCAPGIPTGGGGERAVDGKLWFPTSRGLAVLDPKARSRDVLPPLVNLVGVVADNRRDVDFSQPVKLPPGDGRVQIRYTGIYLSAPERVRYSYILEGLDAEWTQSVTRRVINYNSLPHGHYRFVVRAQLPGGPANERSFAFELMPHFYQTLWFRCLCVGLLLLAGWAVYQLRLQQIRSRFALVLAERARLAREIHDTLAQGFVGISSQLDAVSMCMPNQNDQARRYLDLARKMARHSLTEARRSVMDLRASALEGQDLAAALQSGTAQWTAGSNVEVSLDISGPENPLSQDMEQHLLRIAQEAVTNVLKHAGASRIWVKLHREARKIYLRIVDNGRGFEQKDVFADLGGHFGLIGMRERAERLGGELHLKSRPGEGTQVEVTVPLP